MPKITLNLEDTIFQALKLLNSVHHCECINLNFLKDDLKYFKGND